MKIDRRKVYEKYDGHCGYCGKEIEFKKMQVDHIFPNSRRHWLKANEEIKKEEGITFDNIDDFDNLMPTCRRCNHYKRALSVEQFRHRLSVLHNGLLGIYIFKVAVDYGIVEIKPFNGVFYFEQD